MFGYLTASDVGELRSRFPGAAAFIQQRNLLGELNLLRSLPYLTEVEKVRLAQLEAWSAEDTAQTKATRRKEAQP